MATHEFRIVLDLLPEAEGGGWFATVPDLPDCMSDGETPEAALKSVQDAIAPGSKKPKPSAEKSPSPLDTLPNLSQSSHGGFEQGAWWCELCRPGRLLGYGLE
jgi:predicted RNase H-like HicB family nuclease